MAETFWDSEVILGEVGKNKNEKFVVKKVTKGGKEYKEIRVYYMSNSGDYLPSKKGIVIPDSVCQEILDLVLLDEEG